MIKNRGFTLIEFLVVLSIIVFIVPSLFGLMYSLLRQQTRIIALQEVKRQGDLVFNHMKTTIRNSATATYSGPISAPNAICTTSGSSTTGASSMYFLNATGVNSYFGYSLSGAGMVYEQKIGAASQTQTQLSNSSVTVDSFSIGCVKNSDYSPALVNISYTVSQSSNGVALNYSTSIKLRSH